MKVKLKLDNTRSITGRFGFNDAYVWWPEGSETVRLDGDFTANQLRDIADYMALENKTNDLEQLWLDIRNNRAEMARLRRDFLKIHDFIHRQELALGIEDCLVILDICIKNQSESYKKALETLETLADSIDVVKIKGSAV